MPPNTTIQNAPPLVTVITLGEQRIAVTVIGVPGVQGPPGAPGAPGTTDMQWSAADW